jgi:hypothetical protein
MMNKKTRYEFLKRRCSSPSFVRCLVSQTVLEELKSSEEASDVIKWRTKREGEAVRTTCIKNREMQETEKQEDMKRRRTLSLVWRKRSLPSQHNTTNYMMKNTRVLQEEWRNLCHHRE